MTDEDKQFKAEYAKSSRSACNKCKKPIDKDLLRMAKMIQSPHFDGKQPNWYHFECFFKEWVVNDSSDVAGFMSLRWEDQEKIRKKMAKGPSGGKKKTGGGKDKKGGGKEKKESRSDLRVECAKSDKSTCRSCGKKIAYGEVRIAKVHVTNLDDYTFRGEYLLWYHVNCFLKRLAALEDEGVVPEELTGFRQLSSVRKKALREKFAAVDVDTKSKKRKRSETPPPAVKKRKKKSKEELAREKALKEQNELIWKYRDDLKSGLSKTEMQMYLEANHQSLPKGEDAMLDLLADGMAFGALDKCPTCRGQLTISSHSYQCHGNISEWSKCTYSTDDPARSKWIVPKALRKHSFLKSYKFSFGNRVFPKDGGPTQFMDLTDGPGPSQSVTQLVGGASQASKVDGPLKGFTVYIIGFLSDTKKTFTQTIESLGGRVVTEVTVDTTICLGSSGDRRLCHVQDCDVPVVSEDYLEDSALGDALIKISKHKISSWGEVRHSACLESVGGVEDESKYISCGPDKMTLELEKAAAVDPASSLYHTHHVFVEDSTIWNAVLGQVDIVKGTNSYYKLQLLEKDSGQDFGVFRSWGRVGTTIGGVKTESFGKSLSAAKRSFESLYRNKTGNKWGQKVKKVPGKFYPLDIEYGQTEDTVGELGTGAGSKLPREIQQLVRLLFDIERMHKAMSEFEIDLKKMPLGKLSKQQLQDAYKVLSELLKEIQGDKNPAKIMDASNRFYTLIPHDFGMKKPPPLNTEEVIKLKTMMVDNLLEIEVAYSLLKEKRESSEFKDAIDIHYHKLKTDLKVLPKDSEEFGRLVEYVKNTHGETHSMYELEVLEVFKVDRHGEGDRFKSFSSMHNRQLLWHGSRTTNFCGILSQGLRIAPPEAPMSGYMFGKGVYFADMVSKSANYCRTSRNDNVGLMLLCEVALGDMYELKNSEYVETLPPGKHSTKGLGASFPDPAGNYTTEEGVVIPMGRVISDPLCFGLNYNEYIVYDVRQIHMRYLLKMNFKYKW